MADMMPRHKKQYGYGARPGGGPDDGGGGAVA